MKKIDLDKAQVFDPPVKMLVSDDPGFPKDATIKAEVFCIYPLLKFPIKTIDCNGGMLSHGYAKLIEEQDDEFEEAWNDIFQEACKKVARKIWRRDNENKD